MTSAGAVAIALELILLHRADGSEVIIAPQHVASLTPTLASIGQRNRLLSGEALCAVALTDRRLFAVREPCHVIRGMINKATR